MAARTEKMSDEILRMKMSRTMFEHLIQVEPQPDTIKIIDQGDNHVELEGTHLEMSRWFRDALLQIH